MLVLSKTLAGIIFLAGIVILQIFLSKRDSKWFGLILPIINITFSIMVVLGMTAYMNKPVTEIIMQIIMMFLLYNIATIILLAIYFACRENFKKKNQIDKMNIQDLE